jgi:hypothetical protein
MRIFKCKKRANYSYNKDVLGKKDSDTKWYHSNWPYDNFSLIELLRVEAGEIHDHTVSGSNPVNVNGVLNGTTSRTYVGDDGVTRTYTPSLYD